jgi:hypothetical protein
MVLLFWALSLFNHANAHCGAWGDTDGDGHIDNVPKIVEGPVIQTLKAHYCTGRGKTLYLPRETVRSEAFNADRVKTDDIYRSGGWVWLDTLVDTWDDETIFADIPRHDRKLRAADFYIGYMDQEHASMLHVTCPTGTAITSYKIMEIPETTIKLGR